MLSLPNLSLITNGGGFGQDFFIQARSGGRVELPQVAEIVDPVAGDTRRGIFVTSDGVDSVIGLTSLTSFNDAGGGALSTLNASNGGEIVVPNLPELRSVAITVNTGSQIPTSQIESVVNGSITVNNTAADFSSLTDLTNASITFDGPDAQSDLSSITTIDGASLFATGGATLSLPGVTNYSNSIDDIFRADGEGSVLSLPNLSLITNGGGFGQDLSLIHI